MKNCKFVIAASLFFCINIYASHIHISSYVDQDLDVLFGIIQREEQRPVERLSSRNRPVRLARQQQNCVRESVIERNSSAVRPMNQSRQETQDEKYENFIKALDKFHVFCVNQSSTHNALPNNPNLLTLRSAINESIEGLLQDRLLDDDKIKYAAACIVNIITPVNAQFFQILAVQDLRRKALIAADDCRI